MNLNRLTDFKKTVFIFGIVISIIFIFLFHEEDQLKASFKLVKPDHISVLYLKLLLNTNPDNAILRLELAHQYANLGKNELARNVLKPLLEKNGLQEIEARLLLLEIDLNNYFSRVEHDPNRETELVKLKNSTIEISKNSIPVSLLPKVIQLSLELGQTAVAANLYYRWSDATLDLTKRIEKLQKSGQWYVASNMLSRAAKIYHQCYELAIDSVQARQFALLTVKTLEASGDNNLAVKFARHYQLRFLKDPEFLDEIISLYLVNNDPKRAYEIGALRLALDPDSPEQIKKQIERALAIEEIRPALAFAQKLVAVVPTDAKAHEMLGHIAEWAAMPELAMNEWLWLARNRQDETAISNTIRLSKGLRLSNVTIEMLQQLSATRKLTRDEMNSLLTAYDEENKLFDLIDFLQSYLNHYPDNLQAWKALAKTQENAGQGTEAITTWQHIGLYFNRLIESVTHQALLMWNSEQLEKAFRILSINRHHATTKETRFWKIFAELSWELKSTENALLAYRTLWESKTADAIVAERLIQLTKDQDKPQASIAIGEEAYARFNQPRWLLLSMDVASQAGLPDQLKRLLKKAGSNESQFQELEMYWLMHAQLGTHEKKSEIVIKHYQQALKVSPTSTTAKQGILWTLIDQKDRRLLQSYLNIWRQDALGDPLLWGVYGLALAKVGKNKEALPWFKRKAKINPNDYLWLLIYADILKKAGNADAAWRMRKHVLINLRLRFRQAENDPDKNLADLLHAEYLTLIRDIEGANTDVAFLKMLIAKGFDDPAVRELLITAYLSQENYAAARFWLLQNHAARQQTPAWQRLAIALAENDLAVAEEVLEKENDHLTTPNKIEVLKRLSRNQEALALTYDLLDSHNDQSSIQTNLFSHRDELTLLSSRQLSWGLDHKSLGNIDFFESRAHFSSPYQRGVLATEVKHTQLSSSGSDIILPVGNEVDIAAEFKHPLREGMYQVNLGGNLREDESLAYGAVKISQNITDKLTANLRLGVNEISHETGALRSFGAKDTVLLGLSSQLTRQIFLHLDIDGHRYLTRQGGTLGKGYKLQGILGNSLVTTGALNWQIRLQGTWESNNLKQTLPSELKGLLGASVTNVEAMISPSFGTVGIGTTFRYGASDQGIVRQPFVLADVWAGRIWPANVLGYNGRIAIGTSLLGSDILSIGAFYSNIQGGKTDQAYSGAGLQYTMRFH